MKAWQFVATGEPLALNDVAEPRPASGEVLIEIKAAGLCHSDVGALDDPGWAPLITAVPRTLGHEIAGVIRELGAGVTDFAIGDRVAMLPISPFRPGFARDGGFAALTTAPVESLVRIPDAVTFVQAAAASDSGLTSHRAVVHVAGVKPGMKVGIIGIGGLGQIGLRVAVLKGAQVFAVDLNADALALATELGAVATATNITEFRDQELDVIVDFAGFGTTTAEAVTTVRRGGRVVLVGMGRLTTQIDTLELITGKRELLGSGGGDASDVESVFQYISEGSLTPTLTTITFDEIPEGIDRLRRGEVLGRLVANYEN